MRPNGLTGGRRAAPARVEEAASVRNRHSTKSCVAISAKCCHGTSDDRESPGHGRGPTDGHERSGRAARPNIHRRTGVRHGEAPPNGLRHKVAESNSLHAIDSALPRDTNILPPIRSPRPVLWASRAPPAVAEGDQFEFRQKFALGQ